MNPVCNLFQRVFVLLSLFMTFNFEIFKIKSRKLETCVEIHFKFFMYLFIFLLNG
jgi:hypothetical protein